MKIHPLRKAYNDFIREQYGATPWGDDNPTRTVRIARRVDELEISYNEFVSIAVDMWDDFAANKGHKYPYWNMITGPKTFERLEKLLELAGGYSDDNWDARRYLMFEAELEFASEYVHARSNGCTGTLPVRQLDADNIVRSEAAEALCLMLGVPFHSDNLDYITKQYMKVLQD